MGEYKFLGGLRWLLAVEGYGESRSWLYKCYMLWVCFWNIIVLIDSAYSAFLVTPDKALIIDTLHSALIAMFALWGLATRVLTRRTLEICKEIVAADFYQYPDEGPDPFAEKLKGGIGKEVRQKVLQFLWTMTFNILSNIVLIPVSQYLLVTPEEYEQTVDFSNPYFPHYLYLPWGTRSFIGFIAGLLIHLLIFTYTYGMAIVMNQIYIDCAVQLLVQLKILNHSISQIRERALNLHKSKYGKCPADERSPAFQECLQECLVHNVQHHQVLMRFFKTSYPFIGSIFLLLVFLAAIIFASIFYLIMQGPKLNYLMIYAMQLFAEQSYTYYTCYFGERVMEESGNIFESLYSIDWPNSNKKFTSTLHIFRIFTRRPIKFKSHLLDFTASLESYAEFMSAMYKIMNLMRQSDK